MQCGLNLSHTRGSHEPIMLTCKITNATRTTEIMLYKNHCHVTTIQLLALGHVDNKMRTQFWGTINVQLVMTSVV
jgi:hypothetical protein